MHTHTTDPPATQSIGSTGSLAVWLLAAACALCLGWSGWLAAHRGFIGSPDEAAYALQARALNAGQGLTIPYVQHFYRQYPDIRHREDHYAPGNGLLLAPLFRLGNPEFTATFPSLLIACVLLPWLTFLLARQAGLSPPFALAAALTVLCSHLVREHAVKALADLPFAACVLAALVAILSRRGRLMFAAGAALAAAYYFKPTALLFLPVLLGALALVSADRRQFARRGLLFAAVFAALITPLLARNARLFGNPVFSANQYVAAGVDFDRAFWHTQWRKVWWQEPSPPTLGTLVPRYGVAGVLHGFARRAKTGLRYYAHMGLLAIALLGAPRWLLRRRWPDDLPQAVRRNRQAIAVAAAGFLILLILAFAIEDRYLLPAVPLLHVLAWALAQAWLAMLPSRPALAIAAVAVVVLAGHNLAQQASEPLIPAGELRLKTVGGWLRTHLPPDAHLLAQDALRTAYYSDRPTVNIPTDTPAAIDAVVAHYRIDYLVCIPDGWHAAVLPYAGRYLAESPRGWRRIDIAEADFTLYVRDGAPVPPAR